MTVDILEKVKKSMWWRKGKEILSHFGDCDIYSCSKICTCGLLHYFLPYEKEGCPFLKSLDEDYKSHFSSLEHLQARTREDFAESKKRALAASSELEALIKSFEKKDPSKDTGRA